MKLNYLFLLGSAFLLFSCATQKLQLETLRIPQGKDWVYDIKTVSNTIMEQPDAPAGTSTETTTQVVAYRMLQARANGQSDWEMRISKYRSEKWKNDSLVIIDSEHLSPDLDIIQRKMIAALIQTPMTFSLASNGDLTNLKGFERMLALASDSLDAKQKASLEMVGTQFNDQFIGEVIKSTWDFYPAKKVKKGSKWKQKSWNKIFNTEENQSFKLADRTAEKTTLSFTSVSAHDPEHPGSISFGPVKILYFMDGSKSGKIELDPLTGMMLYSSVSSDFGGNMEIKVPFLANSKVPLKVAATTEVRLRR